MFNLRDQYYDFSTYYTLAPFREIDIDRLNQEQYDGKMSKFEQLYYKNVNRGEKLKYEYELKNKKPVELCVEAATREYFAALDEVVKEHLAKKASLAQLTQ